MIIPLLSSIVLCNVCVALATNNLVGSLFGLQHPLMGIAGNGPSCPIDIPITCTNNTPVENSCCFESPGGIFLQTQFWDYSPPIGKDDEWTLHGLWPDNCDGSYEQFCDNSLNINRNVKAIIVGKFNDEELYDKMTRYWKNFNGDDASLWQHEFNKHGTCVKTLRPSCYLNPKDHQNVYDYYKITVSLYEQLPTYKFLTSEGIVPSETNVYTKQQIQDALDKNFGGNQVKFKCDNRNALQEVWYYHHLQGSILNEKFVEIPALHDSQCRDTGIKWLPKKKVHPTATVTRTTTQHGGKPTKIGERGNLRLENHSGCLISNGKYYEHGTCATYSIFKAPFGGYNIRSSKGYCGVDSNGVFNCQGKNTPTQYQFQWNKDTGAIGYGNKYEWCLKKDAAHGHYPQTPIQLASGDCDEVLRLKFH